MPCKVAKYHDYFTSALPQPQKGEDVLLPLGQTAPIMGTGSQMIWSDNQSATKGNLYSTLYGTSTDNFATSTAEMKLIRAGASATVAGNLNVANVNQPFVADLRNATAATVSQLRQAFAVQRLYEKDARGGTRYIEMIRAHFGVVSPDARQQRPEYLGGFRQQINIDQVIQRT